MTDDELRQQREDLDRLSTSQTLRADSPAVSAITPEQLIATISAAFDHMDSAGGDNCGMPECPWCHSQGTSDLEHTGDCELVAAREAVERLRAALLSSDRAVQPEGSGDHPPLHADEHGDWAAANAGARYYALRDAVTMYAGDGIMTDDAIINEATEHATIAQCCICAVSDNRTERGTPQTRIVPLLSLQRLEWVYPYGSEEPYVRIADLDKISRPASDRAVKEPDLKDK